MYTLGADVWASPHFYNGRVGPPANLGGYIDPQGHRTTVQTCRKCWELIADPSSNSQLHDLQNYLKGHIMVHRKSGVPYTPLIFLLGQSRHCYVQLKGCITWTIGNLLTLPPGGRPRSSRIVQHLPSN